MISRSKISQPLDVITYENFQGLDTSASILAQEFPKRQTLFVCDNGFCDWRGQIVQDYGYEHSHGDSDIAHVRYYSAREAVSVERRDSGLTFRSDTGAELRDVHPKSAVITSTVFNRKLLLLARARPVYEYDGYSFKAIKSPALEFMRPSYCATIQRRFVVAGIPGRETEVHLSRVDAESVMPDDEGDSEESVLRAGKIDVKNLINKADVITGLGSFEQSRLVIFTSSSAVIYRVDPNINEWQLDTSANVNIGCISHNTITNAGKDLMFCSRAGIHSIKRSEDNGILVYSYSLSDRVSQLYQALVATVDNLENISAVWDQDNAQYHVFFPHRNGLISTRLTLSINPDDSSRSGPTPKFSTASFLDQTCGDFLSGRLILGTRGGVYKALRPGEVTSNAIYPEMVIETPMLFHQDLLQQKKSKGVVIQATGRGLLTLEALHPDTDNVFDSITMEIDSRKDDGISLRMPLSRQYQRPFNHSYDRVRFRIRTEGYGGLLRIVSLSVMLRKD